MQELDIKRIGMKMSKGRNGWFHPRRITVMKIGIPEYPDMIEVEVWSRNQTSNPPIDLYLTSDDAKELAMRNLRELS